MIPESSELGTLNWALELGGQMPDFEKYALKFQKGIDNPGHLIIKGIESCHLSS